MNRANKQTIRMVTFNCRSVKRSIEQVRSLCRFAEILLVQETWLLPHDLGFVNEINDEFACFAKSSVDTSSGVLRGRPYGGLAVLWKKSVFSNVTVIDCTSDRLAAIQVNLDCRQFLVVCVYLPTDSEENLVAFTDCLASMAALINDNNAEAVYVLGDFNAHPGARFGDELQSFCSEHSLFCVDTDLLPDDTHTYVSDAHGTKRWLDHCVVTKAARDTVKSVHVEYGVYWSDHFPMVLTCEMDTVTTKICLNNADSLQSIKWGHRKDDQIDLYKKYCCDNLSSLSLSSHCLKCSNFSCTQHLYLIDDFYNDIVNILQTGAKNSASVPNGVLKKPKKIVGWNYHVSESHKNSKMYYRWWNCNGKPSSGELYDKMIESRRVFKNKLKWCQNNEEKIKLDVLAMHRTNRNFIKFWRTTNSLKHKISVPVTVAGVSDRSKIADLFSHHFRVTPMSTRTACMPSMTDVSDNVFLTADDVAAVVLKMKKGKSPGIDGLSLEHILYAGEAIYSSLASLYNACINFGYLPEHIMKTVVVPIPKNKTGDLSSLQNYRPISLGTVLGKVLERLIHPILSGSVKLNDAQFGFRPGLSTDSAIFSLKATVNHYVNKKTSVYACFLDLSRAFDLVNYNLLWEKLHASNVPSKTINLLRYWYRNQTNCVRWGDATSSEYKLECGVRQGGLTSPDLFSLYVNDLIAELRGTRVGCHIGSTCMNNFSYADDMVLLSPSIRGLRKLVAICERYAAEHGLKYNVKKTVTMVFRSGRGPETIPGVFLDGELLERVERFRYLGHVLTEGLVDDEDIERERRALAVRCNMLARRFAKCSDEVKLTLFRTYCLCFYTCQLWVKFTRRAVNNIRVQYNDAYRILMKLPRYCSASGMFAKARVPDFYAIIRSRIASFWRRLRASDNEILSTLAGNLDNSIFKHWLSVHQEANRK